MSKQAKQIISYNDLLRKLHEILDSYNVACRNIHIDVIDVYQEQHDGANWNITRFRRSGNDNDLQECGGEIERAIYLLRATYDVVPKNSDL